MTFRKIFSWASVALALAGVAVITGHPAWASVPAGIALLVAGAIAAGAARFHANRRNDEPSGRRVSNDLVTLSAAAVIAVYAAGFHRTKAAADEFEAQRARRHTRPPISAGLVVSPPSAPSGGPPPVLAMGPNVSTVPAMSALIPGESRSDADAASSETSNDQPGHIPAKDEPMAFASIGRRISPAEVDAQTAKIEAAHRAMEAQMGPMEGMGMGGHVSPARSALAAPTTATNASATSPVAPVAAAVITPAAVTSQTPPPSTNTSAPIANAPAPPTAPAAEIRMPLMPKLLYKDGTFLGWGRSAHGNIQASVVIANGRIASTAIARCETAYSCSWIDALPGQVVDRQDPGIDAVTGASDSSYAFQDAVTAALFKAQRGE